MGDICNSVSIKNKKETYRATELPSGTAKI